MKKESPNMYKVDFANYLLLILNKINKIKTRMGIEDFSTINNKVYGKVIKKA